MSILRKAIGGSLKNSKDEFGLSPDTVKSIQSGRLPFSEKAAITVAEKTGVSCKWLLDLDGSRPPKTESGERFTEETFNRHEAERDKDVRDWSSPVNFNFYRYGCLKQFRTLIIKLAGLVLAAHSSHKVGFVNAKLDNEMRRLAKLLRQEGRTIGFESLMWKQIEAMPAKVNSAENETGLVAIFNQFKKELPAEKKMIVHSAKPTRH